MARFFKLFSALVVISMVAWVGYKLSVAGQFVVPVDQMALTTLQRVKESGVIRCGYWDKEPLIYKHKENGEPDGPMVEFFELAASARAMSTAWIKEFSYDDPASIELALIGGEIDLFCYPVSSALRQSNSLWDKSFDFVRGSGDFAFATLKGDEDWRGFVKTLTQDFSPTEQKDQ
ncbi:MAG: hypothetical protein FWF24_06780 [Alphaproteobacteria bacterium]|nr:hypothetical protein [Alphaproteobacteria bacterium]